MNKYSVTRNNDDPVVVEIADGWHVGAAGELVFWSRKVVAPHLEEITMICAYAAGQWAGVWPLCDRPIDP